MKDIFDSADWAREALEKKKQPRLVPFEFNARGWVTIIPSGVGEIEERPGEGDLVLGPKP